jgi:protein-disulfide isomerase
MAKNHVTPKSDPRKEQDNDELTINIQPYLVPISIIVSGIMISLSVLSLGRNSSLVAGSGTNTVAPTATTTEDLNPASVTSIDDDPYLGNKDTAKVAIVEFSDYECPFCKRHHEQVYPDIIKNYVDNGQAIYVYRDFIAVPSHNPAATQEAYAASCVKELTGSNTKYFEYGTLLYANTQSNGGGLLNTDEFQLASQVGVNGDQLKTCIESQKYKDEMAADEEAAIAAGIQGTPGFVVGVLNSDGSVDGKIVAGAYPYETFAALIEEMLAK